MLLKSMKRETVFLLFLVFLLSACNNVGTSAKNYPFAYSGPTMGTAFSIKVSRLPDGMEVDAIKSAVDELLETINQQMSTYLADSDLSRLNQADANQWIQISPDLYHVLAKAKAVNRLSSGAFDVTIAPLVNLWGFGPEQMTYKRPPAEKVSEKLQQVGSDLFVLDEAESRFKKTQTGLMLDLSALAKGYAVDKVAGLFEEHGMQHFMVEIGGEIRVRGHNLQGQPWRIAIEKPAADQHMIQKIVPVTDISIATSGDYRNFFEQNGKRYSHTIDPRNGLPITHKLASVTVFDRDCMDADAWATALTVLGPEQGYQLAEQLNIAVLMIIKTAEGFTEKSTSAYRKLFEVES